LAEAHRKETALFDNAVRSFAETLKQSRELLRVSASFELAPRLAPERRPAASTTGSGDRGPVVDARFGETAGLASPCRPEPPRQTPVAHATPAISELDEVLQAKRDIARARIVGDNAFRPNPNDVAVVFGQASLLILTGQIDAGIALLTRNSATASNSRSGYHLLMALGCYLKGELRTAAVEAGQNASPVLQPGLVLEGYIANKASDRSHAQGHIAPL
jgi:hypothetical protein